MKAKVHAMCTLAFLFLTLPLLVSTSTSSSNGKTLTLLVNWCPGGASTIGAVVTVDTNDGNIDVVNTFNWDSYCLTDTIPAMFVDLSSKTAYVDLLEDFHTIFEVNLETGAPGPGLNVGSSYNFEGFTNFEVTPDGRAVLGLSDYNSNKGPCTSGCSAFGVFDVATSTYTRKAVIAFQSCNFAQHYLDYDTGVFYVECAIDVRPPSQRCTNNTNTSCMLAINTTTGDILSAVPLKENFQVVSYAHKAADSSSSSQTVLGLVAGYPHNCIDSYLNYAFAQVDLNSTSVSLESCFPHGVMLDSIFTVTAFSENNDYFGAAVGSYSYPYGQLFAYDLTSDKILINTNLTAVSSALGLTSLDPVNVLAVAFL